MPSPGRFAFNTLKALAGFGGRGARGGLLTTGLMGAGMIAAGKGVSAISDTPWGQEQSAFTRSMLGLGSAGLQVGGYLGIARGALGSAQAGFDRFASWRSGRMPSGSPGLAGWQSKVRRVDAGAMRARRFLGGATSQGSALNRLTFASDNRASPLLRGAWGATKAVARAPFRIATGMVDSATVGATNAARFMFGGGGGRSVASLMQPRSLFSYIPGVRGALNATGVLKADRAALGSGLFGWAAASSVATQYINQRGDQMSGWKGQAGGFDPSNYGQGFYAMRRGAANNYGPALTLALHRNSGRVMP